MNGDTDARRARTDQSASRLRVFLWALAFAPVAWLLAIAVFVLRTYLALGRWPKPNDPDPGTLGFTVHYYAIQGGIALVFAGPVTVLFVTALSYRHLRDLGDRPSLLALVAVGGLGLTLLLARSDLGYIFRWLGD